MTNLFYLNEEQRSTAEKLIQILKEKGHRVATKVTEATSFWSGEGYHQDYYAKNGHTPYCHRYTKRF